jgi:hypothetical protein
MRLFSNEVVMANQFTWTQPLVNTDGSVFDEPQFEGYEFEVDGAPAFSVPVAWVAAGNYSIPIAAVVSAAGSHVARVQVAHKDGTRSAYSNTVAFTIQRTPEAPINFSVA